ncbi:MAG: hypothetical protein ACRERV_08065 [Methylococcales bacterium]
MSTEETKKHWIALAPSILTGLAALIAALTTVYINVRNDKSAPATAVQAAPVVVSQDLAAVPAKPLPVQAKIIDLQLERMRVDNDGSMGTTDWTFDIQNGERSLFSVPFKALADTAGDNIVVPKDAAVAHAKLNATANMPEIIVRGWKQGWSGKAKVPDVIGKAKLDADDDSLVIEVKSEKADGAAFVLYFNTRVVQK